MPGRAFAYNERPQDEPTDQRKVAGKTQLSI